MHSHRHHNDAGVLYSGPIAVTNNFLANFLFPWYTHEKRREPNARRNPEASFRQSLGK